MVKFQEVMGPVYAAVAGSSPGKARIFRRKIWRETRAEEELTLRELKHPDQKKPGERGLEVGLATKRAKSGIA